MPLMLHPASPTTDVHQQGRTPTCHPRGHYFLVYFSAHRQEVALPALHPHCSLSDSCLTARITFCKCSSSEVSPLKSKHTSISHFDQPVKFRYYFALVTVGSDNRLVPICKPNLLLSGYRHQPLYTAFPNCSVLWNSKAISVYLKVSFDY